MASVTELLGEIRDGLNDETPAYRWSDATLIRYINAGMRQLVMLLPESNIVEAAVTLVDGARQTLPADGIKFIRVTSNANGEAFTRGSQVKYVERDAMDSYNPAWESVVAADVDDRFQHFVHDPRQPNVFHLYPGATAGMKVYVAYSAVPAPVSAGVDVVPMSDIFSNALIEYAIYRALTKDSRFGVSGDRATQLYNKFLLAAGQKPIVEARVGPQANKAPEGP